MTTIPFIPASRVPLPLAYAFLFLGFLPLFATLVICFPPRLFFFGRFLCRASSDFPVLESSLSFIALFEHTDLTELQFI